VAQALGAEAEQHRALAQRIALRPELHGKRSSSSSMSVNAQVAQALGTEAEQHGALAQRIALQGGRQHSRRKLRSVTDEVASRPWHTLHGCRTARGPCQCIALQPAVHDKSSSSSSSISAVAEVAQPLGAEAEQHGALAQRIALQ
jgi:hypothetical protein